MDSLLERLSQEIHIMRTALPEPTLNEDWGWGSSGGDYSNMIDFSQVDPLSVYPSGIPSVDKPLQSVYPATLKPSESRLSQIGKTGTGGESGSSQHLQSSAVNTPAADVTVYEPERLLNTPNTGVDVDDDSVDVELYGDVGTSHADPTSTSAHAVPHPHTLGLELETLGIVGKLLNSKERIEVGKLWNDAPSWVRGVLDRARLKLDVEQFRTVCRASATCGTPPRFDARNGSTSVNSAAFDMLLSNAGKARRPVEQGSINTARIVSGGVDQVETSTTTMTTNAATTRTSVLSETYAVSGSSCPILQSPRTVPSPRDAESTPPPPPPSSFQKVRDDHQSLLVRRRCQQGARIPRSASAGERPRMSIQPARSPQATPHLVRGGSQALRLLSSKSTPRSANTSLPPSATTQGSSKGTSESNTANAATIRALRTAARSFLTYLQEHEVAGNSFLHAFTDEERQYWYNQCGVHVDQQHTLLHAMAQLL